MKSEIIPAHIRITDGVVETCEEHLQRTAQLCSTLLAPFGLKQTGYLMGLIHDTGKANKAFCRYLYGVVQQECKGKWNFSQEESGPELEPVTTLAQVNVEENKNTDTSENPSTHLYNIDHSTYGAKILFEESENLSLFSTAEGRCAVEWMAMAILSHHGGLNSYLNLMKSSEESDFLRRIYHKPLPQYEEVKAYAFNSLIEKEKFHQLLREAVGEVIPIINNCFQEMGKRKKSSSSKKENLLNIKNEFYFTLGLWQKILYSALIDADRLSTACFMNNEQEPAIPSLAAILPKLKEKLAAKVATFSIDTAINRARHEIQEACAEKGKKEGRFIRFTAPTGSGKTLSVTRYALEQAESYGKERIVLVAPYTGIIEQHVKDLREIFLKDGELPEEILLEYHSQVQRPQAMEAEKEGDEEQREVEENEKTWSYLEERWNAPLIVTTMVQFLNTFFYGGTRSIRRLHALRNSVLIIDESQMIPLELQSLFNMAIQFLVNHCKSTVVLCTATQPPLDLIPHSFLLEGEEVEEMLDDSKSYFQIFQRCKVEDWLPRGAMDAETLTQALLQDWTTYKEVLCIVNTTGAARTLFQKITKEKKRETGCVLHLSAKMCAAHRAKTIKKMRAILDHNRQVRDTGEGEYEPLLVISTQVIQAGIDVSFPLVYRSLAGLDDLAQAAGRCNRHGEREEGIVRIMKVAMENLQHLESIKKGAAIMETMLCASDEKEKELLFMPEGIKRYFDNVRNNTSKEKYDKIIRFHEIRDTLFSLLAYNGHHDQNKKECTERGHKIINRQDFKTANQCFSVIDKQDERSVLVPYDDKGKELIHKIESQVPIANWRNLLKEAQRYIVSITSWEFEYLEKQKGLWLSNQGEIYIASSRYYDKGVGLVVTDQAEIQGKACIV